jgi:hypothetical protein
VPAPQLPSAAHWGLIAERWSAEQVAWPQLVPGAAGWQVPAGLAQVWQVPQETLAQQVPFTQLFETQSPPLRQAAPSGFLTGGPQVIPVQTLPATQSAAVAQLEGHAPALQRYGPHETGVPSGSQAPVPSHLRSWAAPSGVQSGPQLPSGSAIPDGTGVQTPTLPASAQLWHAAVQATSQQTPSEQALLVHSLFCAQGAPAAFFPQVFMAQGIPAAHWVADEHELKQSAAAGLQT